MIGQLLPLAILSAITSPTAIAAVLVILNRPRASALLTAYVIGSVLASVAVGIGIVLLLHAAGTFDPKGSSANPIFDIAIGLIILLSTAYFVSDRSERLRRRAREERAARKARRAAKPHKPSRTAAMLAKGSVGAVAALGVAMHMPGLLYLVALTDIAHADLGTARALVVLLVFNVIMLLPIELPLVSFVAKPDWTQRKLERIDAYLKANERRLLVGGALLTGGYLIVTGFIGLL